MISMSARASGRSGFAGGRVGVTDGAAEDGGSFAVPPIPETDGTPMTVLESMACGTPVVVSDIPDYDPHYIEPGETVLSARPQDTAGLAQAILRLLDDSDLVGRLAAEAWNRVRMIGGYEAQMSRMEELYISLANNDRPI